MTARLFIANRGEIARRAIRAAHALGVETVLGVSEADRDSPAAREAGRTLVIGPAAPARSYLSTPLLLHAATASGCTALYPGYGFLSERADFARAVEEAGLAFVGPTSEQIAAIGDKLAARALAGRAGVPIGAGSGPVNDDAEAVTEARKLGFPVVTKASAGGGGRGMRIVGEESGLPAALSEARAEAKAAFGDDRVYLEPFVDQARHVEVQAFGLGDGRVLTLGTRDCSIQRRYQKLVEEAPAAAVPQAARDAMEDAARALLAPICYRGAGTVEFLWDEARADFRFLEVNARIQVEHPVTEAIFGVDLVEWQIALALGRFQPPTLLLPSGHAIEARILAEDADFRPSPGRISRWEPPCTARVDSAVEAGTTVSPFYDSLIAKLIVTGEGRETAVNRLSDALDGFQVEGVATTIAFLKDLARHPDFLANRVSTRWLETAFLPQRRAA